MPSHRLYYRGALPCGHCQMSRHAQCRPRLDGTLCSCNCERAEMARGEYQRKAEAARAAGDPEPAIGQALEILHPRYRQEWPTEV